MKKFFQVVGMISLICVSFFVTEKTANVVKDADTIMIEIKKKNDSVAYDAIDATIDGNTIIPGISGKEVDIDKSYDKMKRYGSYLESLLEYQLVAPQVSLSKNYDKYVISGNPTKNMVTFIFLVEESDDVEEVIKQLEKTNTPANFFLDGNWFEKNNSKVLELIEDGYEVGNLSYGRNYQDSSFVWMDTIIKKVGKQKNSYCYSEEENLQDLEVCALNRDHTIMPSIVIQNYPSKEVKEQLEPGSIIAFPINDTVIQELSTIIRYVESKGYKIVNLKEHLTE